MSEVKANMQNGGTIKSYMFKFQEI